MVLLLPAGASVLVSGSAVGLSAVSPLGGVAWNVLL